MLEKQLKGFGSNVGGLSNIYVVVLGTGINLKGDFGFHLGANLKGFANPIVFAAISDPSPGSFAKSPNGSIDEYINTLAHELLEAFSDPLTPFNPAWVDPTGPHGNNEIGDKCFPLGYRDPQDGADLVAPNGHRYLVQQMWSNETPPTLNATVGSCQMSSPAIVQLTPASGPDGGGTFVEILGGGFDTHGGTNIVFGGIPAHPDCQSANLCFVTTPPLPILNGSVGTGTPSPILTNVDVTATVGGYTSTIARAHQTQIDLTTFEYAGAPCTSVLHCSNANPSTFEITINCSQSVTFFDQVNLQLATGTTYSTVVGDVPTGAVIACECGGECPGLGSACTRFSTFDPNPQQCGGPPECNGQPEPSQHCGVATGWRCCGACPAPVGNCGWVCGVCQ
jgi:hypothetical protein